MRITRCYNQEDDQNRRRTEEGFDRHISLGVFNFFGAWNILYVCIYVYVYACMYILKEVNSDTRWLISHPRSAYILEKGYSYKWVYFFLFFFFLVYVLFAIGIETCHRKLMLLPHQICFQICFCLLEEVKIKSAFW